MHDNLQLELTAPGFLAELERLRFTPRFLLPGHLPGERASPRRGSSQEFKDYRSYSLGDELRFLDWNAYARFRKPYLKLFLAEEEVDVYLFVDLSGSMGWGSPPKLYASLRLAAALAYLVLAGEDRVGLLAREKEKQLILPPVRGINALFPFLRRIEQLHSEEFSLGRKDLQLLLSPLKRRSVLFLLSDFFFEEGYEKVLQLLARRHYVTLIQILDSQEMSPSLDGDITLLDPESGEKRELTINGKIRQRYRELLTAYNNGLSLYARRKGMGYVLAQSGEALREIVVRVLSSMERQKAGFRL